MGSRRGLGLAAGVAALVVVLASCSQPNSGSGPLGVQAVPVAHGNPLGIHPAGPANAPVCPGPLGPGAAGCTSRVIVNKHGKPVSNAQPAGYTVDQIRTAYGFGSLSNLTNRNDGSGQTIALVDAYDDPTAAADLATFKAAMGIAASDCSFSKVDQAGGSSYPKVNTGWALEMSLDVQWACAIAPGANILLVEANSNSFSDLMTAVAYAAAHAQVVSMSWGGSESSSESTYDAAFQAPGVTFTASSGDSGTGVIYPAASPYVVGVGGTTLPLDNSGTWSGETAWSGSGGGISAYEVMPGYQSNLSATSIGSMLATYANGMRGVPDVAYDANPSTGFSVYDSTSYQGTSGWFVVGGTSAGSPQWAALFALADQLRASSGAALSSGSASSSPVYAEASAAYGTDFHDITSGNDCSSSPTHGHKSSGGASAVCTAQPGYDFVTGLGSPQAGTLVSALAGY